MLCYIKELEKGVAIPWPSGSARELINFWLAKGFSVIFHLRVTKYAKSAFTH